MKKYFLMAACVLAGFAGFAQKQNIQNAINSLSDKEYEKAAEFIEKAVNDPSTKDNAKAWFTRAKVYMAMSQEPQYKTTDPYQKAMESYLKVAELDAKYEKDVVSNNLKAIAYNNYNSMVEAYNSARYNDALKYSKNVSQIFGLEGGKKYSADKSFDTVAQNAKLFGAYSAVNTENYTEALPALAALKNNPVVQSPNIYLGLAAIYKKQNNNDELIKVIEEGRQAFPNNKALEAEELIYYTSTGKQDVFLKKLEDAAAKDPNNANYWSSLATAYTNMAFPKDNAGKDLPKPANYRELLDKAGNAYATIMKIAPDDALYNFNAGVFHFNQGSDYVSQMNDVKGNTAADNKKIDELSKYAGEAFDKAVVYFEKTTSLMEPKLSSLPVDDKRTYSQTLSALRQIYTRQNKMDKANEVKAKLQALGK